MWLDRNKIKTVAELNGLISATEYELICIHNPELADHFNHDLIVAELQEADIIHAGLLFQSRQKFDLLRAFSFNWHFLDPRISVTSSSWKGTSDFICFHVDVFSKLNGMAEGLSLDGAIMEFCFRSLIAGANIKCMPKLLSLPGEIPSQRNTISDTDLLYFVRQHLGNHYFQFAKAYLAISRLEFPRRVSFAPLPPLNSGGHYRFKIFRDVKVRTISAYTAIIPTIDRYEYIGRSIESLLKCDFPPSEILVVDQTAMRNRRPDVYQRYIDLGVLRVFYLDSPGQSTARNLAIREAKNDWLLLWEDDTEAWPEMIREHLRLLEHSYADVSTGVSLAPWKDESFIPERLRRYHIADVLATGNAFLSRATALSVNGLDPAFDRGSGADDDFGKRLFLNGKLIVFNHKAIQTHHKAPQGGMRVHGSWWRNKSTLFGPYPPATQVYTIWKYYSKKYRLSLFLSLLLKAKKRYSWPAYLLFWLLLPLKVVRSHRQANRLLKKYPVREDIGI